MRIGAINYNENIIKPAFKATFVENEFSQELRAFSSKEDIEIFEKACESLNNAKRDPRYYLLDGVTINNGMAGESEIDDKFIKLGCKFNKRDLLKSIRMWILKGEECVSGGYEKKNVLREVATELEKIAKENINPKFVFKKI